MDRFATVNGSEYINEDPYDAWIVKVRVADEDELENLLNSDSYEASID